MNFTSGLRERNGVQWFDLSVQCSCRVTFLSNLSLNTVAVLGLDLLTDIWYEGFIRLVTWMQKTIWFIPRILEKGRLKLDKAKCVHKWHCVHIFYGFLSMINWSCWDVYIVVLFKNKNTSIIDHYVRV